MPQKDVSLDRNWQTMGAQFDQAPARRYVDVVRDLPVRETAMVQLSPGDPVLTSMLAVGTDVLVSRNGSIPLTTGYLVPVRGWTAYIMPLSWSGTYLLNGRETNPGDVLIAGDNNGYAGTGAGRDLLGVMIRNKRFLPALAAMAGRPGEILDMQDWRLGLGPRQGAAIRQAALRCIANAQLPPNSTGIGHIPADVEGKLIDTISACLSHFLFDEPEPSNAGLNDFDIVARAVRGMEQCGHVPSLSDLCQKAGVGKTRLWKSFMTVHDVSPARFLKLVRLTRLGDWLSDPEVPPRSVKDAVLGLGFSGGGRVAAEYAQQYGEMPSQTLERTLRLGNCRHIEIATGLPS